MQTKSFEQVLTETLARTMKAEPLTTHTTSSQPVSSPRFDQFKTFGDPQLEFMVKSASEFVVDFKTQSTPHWLSFIGNSGTGKTFLANMVYEHACKTGHLLEHRSLISGVSWAFWPMLLGKLRNGKYWLIDDLSDANFCFIDEIAVEHDPSGFCRDKLCELLCRRVNKWTVITSNLTLEKMSQIDNRITSRMVRGKSRLVQLTCPDYALR